MNMRRGIKQALLAWLCAGLLSAPAYAITFPDENMIDTLVGGGNGDGGPALNAILDPRGLVVTGAGEAEVIYIADALGHRVRKVYTTTVNGVATKTITTVAGTGVPGFSGDGGPAVNAQLQFPLDVALDAAGHLYIADTQNNRIRQVSPTGIITTVAGNGVHMYGGDGGSATLASLAYPYGLAVGSDGALYIADFINNRIRKVANGTITTVAGGGNLPPGSIGDGGLAINAKLINPTDVVVDPTGHLYIADYLNHRIRRVTPGAGGTISTIAGGANPQGSIGDGGPALAAKLNFPFRLALTPQEDLLIADSGHRRVRQVAKLTQIITTLAGNGTEGDSGDGGPAIQATLQPLSGLAVAATGQIYLAGTTGAQVRSPRDRIRLMTATGTIQAAIGGGNGDGGHARDALIAPQGSVVVERTEGSPPVTSDYWYVADGANHRIRRVNLDTGIIETIAGNGTLGAGGDGGPALQAQLNSPRAVAVASDGTIYLADTANSRVRKIASDGVITTIAGTGQFGFNGDGPATQAWLSHPWGLAVDLDGALYIADFQNNRIRKVANGLMTTVAGTGQWGFSGDGGQATAAKLANPSDVAVGADGSLYISDFLNNRIRKVDSQGKITTYAGGVQGGYAGDGGLATAAFINRPLRIVLDAQGHLFIADSLNQRIRWVHAQTLNITTLAGIGLVGGEPIDEGDGGLASAASLSEVAGVAVDAQSHVFISLPESGRVRVVTFSQASSLPGDLNLSGEVDASDLQLMVNVLLGIPTTSEIVTRAGALDSSDPQATATDLQRLVNILLGN